MAFNGSGTFNLVAGNPVTTGTTISSTWANNTLSDMATGLTNCVTRDGQSPATANLPMGGFKLTGLASGTSAGDSVRYEQIVKINENNTWSGTQAFTGTSSTLAEILTNAGEVCTVSATAATGTINYDVTTQSVLYYTSNASANWTLNIRGSSGTSLNSLMSIGQSITIAFIVTQGTTAYYNNVLTIDGTSVTPKYQGGSAWIGGNPSSIDSYVYTIIKTADAVFTVLASQTQYK